MRFLFLGLAVVGAGISVGCNSSAGPQPAVSESAIPQAHPPAAVSSTGAGQAGANSKTNLPTTAISADTSAVSDRREPAASNIMPPKALATAAAPTSNGWVPFTSREEGFTIQFPLEPTRRDSADAQGNPKSNVLAIDRASQVIYSLQISLAPAAEDARVALQQSQAGMIKSLNGVLVKDREMHLGNWNGRAFTYFVSTPKDPDVQHVRIYLVDRRSFVMTVVGNADRVNEDVANQFFDSFALLAR